jgi:hypothetical protein
VSQVYQGKCFCGAIKFELRGAPLLQGYCHCQDCRDWGGAPFIAFMLVPYNAYSIIEGEEHLLLYARKPETPRGHCARCGGGIGAFRKDAEPPHVGTGPYAFGGFPFEPTMHVFCDEAVLTVPDDLPHYRNIPAELGGTGELIAGSAEH